MKKLLLFSSIILLCISCSDDSTRETAVPTTNVVFNIDQPSTGTTAKQIKRNNIPVWVKSIYIKAASNVFGTYFIDDNYTFDQQNGAAFITLDKVAVGSNTFTASTDTDSPKFYQLTNYTTSGTIAQRFAAALDNIDNENPYVLYNGSTTSSIASNGSNAVNIPMTTLNGRILTVFQVSDELRTFGLQAKITASVQGLSSQTAITKGNELVTFKWSDENSVKDKEVTYKVEVSSINNQSTILKTYTVSQKVLASTSLSCFYTVNADGITLTRNDVKITLNFQDWVNAQCTDCD